MDVPNDPDKTRIKLKYLNAGEQQEVIAKARKLQFDFSDAETKAHMVPDEIRLRNSSAIARIVDWENVYGPDGEVLKCTDKNKVWFVQQDGFLDILNDLIAELEKLLKKNGRKRKKTWRTRKMD